MNYFECKEHVVVVAVVGMEGDGHTCWKETMGEKIVYFDIFHLPLSLLA